jgi:hypothetical protein
VERQYSFPYDTLYTAFFTGVNLILKNKEINWKVYPVLKYPAIKFNKFKI